MRWYATWPDLIRIFLIGRDRRLGSDARQCQQNCGEAEIEAAFHGRQISGKDSIRASRGYKSEPRWINSIS